MNEYPTRAWSRAEDQRLRELAQTEETYGVIGGVLGRTRSSVIGRANRLGIKLGYKPKPPVLPKPQAKAVPIPKGAGSCVEPHCRSPRQPGRSRCARCHTLHFLAERDAAHAPA